MPHDRSPNRCDSLSDRALRRWPEAAVLLILFVAARSILCAGQQFQSNAARFPRLNVPRFVAIARPLCIRAFRKTLLGRLRCCSKFIVTVVARPCWAAQPCWRYLTLWRLQALKISLRQIHQRRRKRLKSRRRLLRLPRRRRSRHHRRLHRRPHRKSAVVEHTCLKSTYAEPEDLRHAPSRGVPRHRQ